jgi:chromosome partitioning protein
MMMTPIKSSSPALPDVRPAPQAGCFVSGLSISCESQGTCNSLAFGTVTAGPSSTLVSWLRRSRSPRGHAVMSEHHSIKALLCRDAGMPQRNDILTPLSFYAVALQHNSGHGALMRTLTLVTQKGGTGKTTLATSLAVAAMEAGETVALFDLDPQRSLVGWGGKREKAKARAEKAENADLAARLDAPHVQQFPMNRVAEMPALIRGLKGFSLIILDTPGADTTATHLAMEAATLCLVPMRPTRIEADAVMPTVQALLRGKNPFAFILNQCSTIPNNNRAAEMAAGLRSLGVLAEPLICQRADYQDAYAVGQGVTEYAPKSKAAEEMRALWLSVDELAQEQALLPAAKKVVGYSNGPTERFRRRR